MSRPLKLVQFFHLSVCPPKNITLRDQ